MKWIRNPIWLLPLTIAALSLVLFRLFPSRPSEIHPPTQFRAVGPNLLKNASFDGGLRDWLEYHNRQPMVVAAMRGSARIRIAGTTNSVQEIYQAFSKPPTGPLIARGIIRITGDPLPGDAAALVIFVDSTNRGRAGFSLVRKNGIGTFPFTFTFIPNGVTKDFTLAVWAGKRSNKKTTVAFDHLSVLRATEEDVP